MTLWQIDIRPAEDQPDYPGDAVATEILEMGVADHVQVKAARGFLLQGGVDAEDVRRAARQLLSDPIVENAEIGRVGEMRIEDSSATGAVVYVLPKPGVTDPVANSTQQALADIGLDVDAVRTYRRYTISGLGHSQIDVLCQRMLANDSIEDSVRGELTLTQLSMGSPYQLEVNTIPLTRLDENALQRLSIEGQLYFSDTEMATIQQHYRGLGREPTDIELETIAQTWSEHCSHKTLAGRIAYEDENGKRSFENMLKETIFAATVAIRKSLGKSDWCVKVFSDNAGIVKFDSEHHVVFKVETHNHPSAIEPYGGANTGLGGVIRDPLGTGLGAKPVCNTDVFCFAPPDMDINELPPGVLHPRRVMKGVVSGVRDYGNRMGIPTVNGAVYFDKRYLGNPLVYCGNVGLLPVDKADKEPQPGDYIVAMGGRTGRDGIHGATFSSVELTEESESISGGAVQIGNAITEKMVLDVLMQARDEGLYTAVTDCGAGGFSSAVGEMGEEIGAEVWLDQAPVKYEGLSYCEIWISEAQERMVLAVPPRHWERLRSIAAEQGVEVSVIGKFVPTGQLQLKYGETEVGCLSMEFLHGGRPPVIRQATYKPKQTEVVTLHDFDQAKAEWALQTILGSWNVASKQWVIRQYDHEVQAGSVIKPLVGVRNDGPGDAAVVAPKLGSRKGLVVSCGMNPKYGDLDPYHMATSAMDEAMRNAVAVGANPDRIAVLDNFCWGNTERPETLGSLVRAAIACHDLAVTWQTPFISGKDSLNNEFAWLDQNDIKRQLTIPSSLLISALGQVEDVMDCVTMDLKQAGSRLYLVGPTQDELGGSHLLDALDSQRTVSEASNTLPGHVPKVDAALARRIFQAIHQAILQKTVRSCHDLSEGGLAVAVAEMAFAGELGVELDISKMATDSFVTPPVALFSESNSRFLCEVPEEQADRFEQLMDGLPCFDLGRTVAADNVQIRSGEQIWLDVPWSQLKRCWQGPLDWD